MGAVDPLLGAIFDEHLATHERTRDELLGDIMDLARDLGDALEQGGRLVVFGNGGSAADSQHFAAELVGRFDRPREPLPAIALTTDTSALTAIGNDFDYGEVFARQVRAHVRGPDLVVAISTSGRAESVVRGAEAARIRGARTWGLTGEGGGRLAGAVDRCLRVPSRVTARIQEVHITVIHAVCALLDARIAAAQGDGAAGVEGDGASS
jgi:D-sedoheptulose 7-phosphate isomerase